MSAPFPKVSIITACLNSACTIRDAMESVLAQDYPNIEHIIVDGGSTDGTLKIVRQYPKRLGYIISEPDRGIYDAMNKGIRAATGEIVGTLNSDDFYSDRKAVSDLVGTMMRNGTDSVFADVVIVDPRNLSKVLRYYDSGKFHPGRFRFGWMPAHPTFFIKRTFYDSEGLFSLQYRIAADFEMLIRLLYKGGASYSYLPRPVVTMRAGGTSNRGLRQSWRLNREIVTACRSNGIWTALPLVLLKIPLKLLEAVRRS